MVTSATPVSHHLSSQDFLLAVAVFFLQASSGSNKMHKVLKPFSINNARGRVLEYWKSKLCFPYLKAAV